MAVILNIETSCQACSAALTAEGMVLVHREDFGSRNHAAVLSQFVKDCLDHAADHEIDLDAVAVSMGPGSYTGLRIGLSEAKGLCYALDKPLIGIDTLKIMAVSAMFDIVDIEPDAFLVPMIDARRMEVYTAAYDMALEELISPTPMIVEPGCLDKVTSLGRPVYFFGDGAAKSREILEAAGAKFVPDIVPLAVDMIALADQAWSRRQFLDLAYSTPTYLKAFIAGKPHVKGLQ